MTDQELYDRLLENGAHLHSFVIVDDKKFEDEAINNTMGSFPVWTKESLNIFIDRMNDSEGIYFICNGDYNWGAFDHYGGFLRAYIKKDTLHKRLKKIGRINYEIFKRKIYEIQKRG